MAGVAALLVLGACATPGRGVAPAEREASLWLVQHGWHTGIALRRADLPPDAWPMHRDLPGGEFLEVGWGNEAFYTAPAGTLWLALRAVWPSPSVLHVAALDRPVAEFFAGLEVVELAVSASGLRRLADFLEQSYARDANEKTVPLGPGLYGRSRFYQARERYSLLRTCHTWTAEALHQAGVRWPPGAR